MRLISINKINLGVMPYFFTILKLIKMENPVNGKEKEPLKETIGQFKVKNSSAFNISGQIRHCDGDWLTFNLKNGDVTEEVGFISGWNVKDVWEYAELVIGANAPKAGTKNCAFYAKDEGHGTVIVEFFHDQIKVTPPVSGSCSSYL
jgi:hypothetical protein